MSERAERVDHEIDEKWMPEWVAWGLLRFGDYLANHARFEAWCQRREEAPGESEG